MIDIQNLEQEVALWRSHKKSLQERMPKDLKKKIFQAINHYPITELRQRLRLNNDFFKQKLQTQIKKNPAPQFIQTQLPDPVPANQTSCSIKLQIGNISLEITG